MSYRVLAIDTTDAGNAKAALAPQAASITDASVAHALNSTFSDTEAEDALDALGAKINEILDCLDAAGLTA